MGSQLIYGILYLVTIGAALGVLLNKDTVKSAMCLVLLMLSIAVHYLFMAHEFVFAIQIVVYAGAIMVLFLFVIMLLNLREREIVPWYMRNTRFIGIALGLVFFFLMAVGVTTVASLEAAGVRPLANPSIPDLATLLTTKYVVPFILTSILLLVAVIGAVVMGRRGDPETGELYELDQSENA